MTEMFSRWREGLAKSSKGAFGRLAGLLGATEIKEDTWEALEGLLVQADVGIETAADTIDDVTFIDVGFGMPELAPLGFAA